MRSSSNPGGNSKTANGPQWTRMNETVRAHASNLSEADRIACYPSNPKIFAFISVHSRLKSLPQGMKWQHESHKEIEGLWSGKFQHPGLFNHGRSCWLRFAAQQYTLRRQAVPGSLSYDYGSGAILIAPPS